MIKITDYANLGENLKVLSTATELLRLDGAEVVVVWNNKILEKFETGGFKFNAILHRMLVKDTYELILNTFPDKPLPLVLCHEAVHLSQFLRGDLITDIEKKTYVWKGRLYGNDTLYEGRPWEIEALSQESSLLKKVNSTINPKRGCLFRKKK